MAKKKDLPENATRLQKAFGIPNEDDWNNVSTQFTSREDYDAISYVRTGILPIDLLTKGRGMPKGRIIHFWCENGIGKTTTYYDINRSFLNQGMRTVWQAFEPTDALAFDMGLLGDNTPYQPGQFRYVPSHYYSDLDKITRMFIASDYDFMFLDSLTAVTPSPELIAEVGLEKARIGTTARVESDYLKWIQAWTADTGKSIFYITQARTHIATQPWDKTKLDAAGGQASKFYSDIRISMRGAKGITTKDLGMEGPERNIGTQGWIFVEKARHAQKEVKIPITILFGKGVSNLAALQQFLKWSGNLVVGGGGYSTITIGGQEVKVRGAAEVFGYLKQPEVYKAATDLFYTRSEDYFNHWVEESTYTDD